MTPLGGGAAPFEPMPGRTEKYRRLMNLVAEGLSQREAATRVGVPPSTAWKWIHEGLPSSRGRPRKAVALASEIGEARADRLLRTMRELKARGLSYRSVAVVMELYEGVEMHPETVRAWMAADEPGLRVVGS